MLEPLDDVLEPMHGLFGHFDTMLEPFDGVLGSTGRESDDACRCNPTFEGDRLVVAAGDCPGRGALAGAVDCRATVVAALTERDADVVLTRADGLERAYEDGAAALLTAAGRFADAAAFRDETLALTATRDPLRAARKAAGRAGAVARIAAESGLLEGTRRVEGYDEALRPYEGPRVARSRVATRPPPDGRLVDRRELDTGAVVRIYGRPNREVQTYHLEPAEAGLDPAATATLATAHEHLATGDVRGGDRAPGRAVWAVAGPEDPVDRLGAILRKHTRGLGVLEDFFADDEVSDVFATAPVGEHPLRIRVDGESMRTNVRLTERGAEALASRFRLASGRSFSRASPTLDATARAGDRQVRVAGVTDPASDGLAFAFRAHDRQAWTLPALVANGTLPTSAAALLSLAVERGAAVLLAGARGAGKTTLLGALLWELPASTRLVCIEDTPELPIDGLRAAGRDVQPLRVTGDPDGPELEPAAALRTALRLGKGALVVGEVRGEEARVLYEAMRVGAADGAVLGTIHGDGAATVRERVVTDLGVPETAFADTDLIVTVGIRDATANPTENPTDREPHDDRVRRVTAVEEVIAVDDGSAFQPLFEPAGSGGSGGSGLSPTGRIDRGNSRLVAHLARSGESYGAVRDALEARATRLSELAGGRTDPDAVVRAHASRRADG